MMGFETRQTLTTEQDERFLAVQQAYDADSTDRENAMRLGQLYAERGFYDKALDVYENLNKSDQTDYAALLACGTLSYLKKNMSLAQQRFSQCTRLKPDRIEGWNNLGIVQLSLSEHDAAKQSFEKVLQLDPENHGALLNLGNYYDLKNSYSEAIDYFTKAVAAKPDFSDGWYNLGNAYLKDCQYERAKSAFQKALKFDPQLYSAFKNYGYACACLSEHERALELYNKALELDKEDWGLYVNIAYVYLNKNEFDTAKEYFLRGVKHAPQRIDAWLGLRQLALKKGDLVSYFKTSNTILTHLNERQIAQTLETLRLYNQEKSMHMIVKTLASLNRTDKEIDAELMLYYQTKETTATKARLLYSKLHSLASPSDHIVRCCAHYCFAIKNGEGALNHLEKITDKLSSDHALQWMVMIDKKQYSQAQEHIKSYLRLKEDCFEAWYQLSRIYQKNEEVEEAKQCLAKALETGFTALEQILNDPGMSTILEQLKLEQKTKSEQQNATSSH
ncbi:MAG: tetratricopeptide repeat protein [Chitinivibrionales bacterium]|nr:tetratricopeptide repeat protein [Chitinivibrionales bacterium]